MATYSPLPAVPLSARLRSRVQPLLQAIVGMALCACGGGQAVSAGAGQAAGTAPTTTATTPASPTNSSTAPTWTLVWSDEFNAAAGTPPNPAYWRDNLGNAEANGWGNRELQTYTAAPRNAFHDGQGHLVLRAERTPNAGPCWNGTPCQYTSARILTQGKVNFSYGKVEARIQVPAGQGLWPAFWALGENSLPWPRQGEIDIMEYVGKTPNTIYGTAHGPGYSGADSLGKPFTFTAPVADDFHVFTVIKRPQELVWLVNGVEYHRLTPAQLPKDAPWVFEGPFFLLLNLAVGGDWPGSPDATTRFPASMRVDWVRVYRAD